MARHAHVQLITTDGQPRLLVDGMDITKSVLSEGFSITEDFSEGVPGFRVSLVIASRSVDVDLPQAVLDAVREAGVADHE